MALDVRNPEAKRSAARLAASPGEPLLLQGDDFAPTDIVPARP